jgi:hypothetical protein
MTKEAWLHYFRTSVAPNILLRKAEGGFHAKQFCIAGRNVRVFSATAQIAEEFSQSLRHLEIPLTETTDLDIHVWERTSQDSHMISSIASDEEVIHGSDLLFQFHHQCISIYDRGNAQAYFWINSLRQLGDWHRAKPFRSIVHWFLSEHGLSMIHGAVVGTENGSVLITAKGGSGKTTTALTCFLEGMNYLSDDYVAIDCEARMAYSLFNSAMLTDDNLLRFPVFRPHVKNPGRSGQIKALVYLHQFRADRLRSQAPLKAVLIPSIVNTERTAIVPTNRMNALMAIVPTIRSLRNFEQEKLSAAKQLVETVPCHALQLGADMKQVAAAIRTFIDS